MWPEDPATPRSGLGHAHATQAEEPYDPDVEFLKDSKVATDGPGLLKYLAERSGHDDDLLRVDELIRQLGSADFKTRRQAAEKLIALGPPAHARLLETQKDKDKERARGAKEAAEQINRAWNFGLNLTVVRRLVKLASGTASRVALAPGEASGGSNAPGSAGAAKFLLQFLPYAADPECEEEIWFGLDSLGKAQPQVLAVLADLLEDKLPIRRAATGYLFSRRGNADQRAAGRKLLADPDPLVRLRTAQGLLGAKDKDAVPVLIELLEKLRWTEEAWQAEEMLHYVAGEDSPEATIGGGSPEARQKCRKAWEEWWQGKGNKLDIAKLDQEYRRPGLILLRTWSSNRKNPHSVSVIGCDGRPRWELELFAWYVQLISHDRILVVDWPDMNLPRGQGAMGVGGSDVGEHDLNGNDLWHAPGRYVPILAYRLPNRETIILQRYKVTAISPEGTELYSRVFLRPGKRSSVECLLMLSNGRVLCDYEDRPGQQLWQGDLATGAMRDSGLVECEFPRMNPYTIREVPGKGYLITTPNQRHVEEVDAKGKRVWQTTHVVPLDAAPLRNGNMLILSGTVLGCRLIEVTRDRRTLSESFVKGSAKRLSPVVGLVTLGFDQPRPAELNLESSIAHRLKGLNSKDPFVRSASAYLLGERGPEALPAAKELIAALDDADETVRSWAEGALAKIGTGTVPDLVAASKENRPRMRASIGWIFGQFTNEGRTTVPVLIRLLQDENTVVRRKAACALGRIGPDTKAAVPALIKALKDPDKVADSKDVSVSQAAALALGGIGPEAKAALPGLIAAIESSDSTLRALSIRALPAIAPGDKEVVATLLELLKERQDLGTRGDAANALGYMGPVAKDAVPLLIELLKVKEDKKPVMSASIRKTAVSTLGKIGKDAQPAMLAIQEALTDPDPGIRSEAALALEKIGR